MVLRFANFILLLHCMPFIIPVFVFCWQTCFVPTILIDCTCTQWTQITNSWAANQVTERDLWKAQHGTGVESSKKQRAARRGRSKEQKGRKTDKQEHKGRACVLHGGRGWRRATWAGFGTRYDTVKNGFDNFFLPKKNVIYECTEFNKRVQQPLETVDVFITALSALAKNCMMISWETA